MKILVVYYTRTATTKKVAEAISGNLNCDIEEIYDTKSRAGFGGFISAALDSIKKKPAVIKPIKNDPSQYDMVILGTPIWGAPILGSSMSTPIRAYIGQNKDKFKKTAFFCAYRVKGSEVVFAEMEDLCEQKPGAVLALKADEMEKDYSQKIRNFVDGLG